MTHPPPKLPLQTITVNTDGPTSSPTPSQHAWGAAEDERTFLGRVGSGIVALELDSILPYNGKAGEAEKDPKMACIEELAEWMVAQSQQHLEAEICSRGRLAELPSSSFYAVLWAIREASQSLFYGDKSVLPYSN